MIIQLNKNLKAILGDIKIIPRSVDIFSLDFSIYIRKIISVKRTFILTRYYCYMLERS